MRALRDNGIEVTALHSHMLNEQPRLFFMHFWANDDATALARGLRAALDQTAPPRRRVSGESIVEPSGFALPHILLTAVVAAVGAYALLRLLARELRERDDLGVAVAVGIATLLLRYCGTSPPSTTISSRS